MREAVRAIARTMLPAPARQRLRAAGRLLQTGLGRAHQVGSLVDWHLRAPRPALDRRRMRADLGRLGVSHDDTPFPAVRTLAHVAFHFLPSRLKYLREVVEQLRSLPLERLELVVDTNTASAIPYVSALAGVSSIRVWDRLEDPLKLTWMHRSTMAGRVEEFDLFLYIEDDILIAEPAMRLWLREAERLAPLGFMPGLVRVEHNRSGELILSDYVHPAKNPKIIEIDGTKFLANPFPYQACWLCTREHMRRFVRAPSFPAGAEGQGLYPRERMAVGAIYDDVPAGYPSRALVPLTDDLRIAPEALVLHMPSNYGRRLIPHPAGYGTVRLADWLTRG